MVYRVGVAACWAWRGGHKQDGPWDTVWSSGDEGKILSSYLKYGKELEDGEKAESRWEMVLLLLHSFLQGQCRDGGGGVVAVEEKGI